MAIQRSLRLAGTVLLALTALSLFALPAGMVPMLITVILAGLTALDLLAVLVLTLVRDHSFRGFVQALLYLSLLLIVIGGFGSQMWTSALLVGGQPGVRAELYGTGMDGYTLDYEGVVGESLSDAQFDIVLTRPDQVSIHETISQSEPLTYDGIEVHPVQWGLTETIFLVRYDGFRPLIWIGGLLFAIGLGLSVVPAVRKRGEG